MFLDSEFQRRKKASQCQQGAEKQQEQSGDLGKYYDQLAKSLLHGRAPISNVLFYFLALTIIIGGM
jgi:hypothetical protein